MENANNNKLSDDIAVFEMDGSKFIMKIKKIKNSQHKNTSSHIAISSPTTNLTPINSISKNVLLKHLPEKKRNLAAALLLRQLKRQKQQQLRRDSLAVVKAPLTSGSKESSLNKQLVSTNSHVQAIEQKSFNKKLGYKRRMPFKLNIKPKCVILRTLKNCLGCRRMIKSEDFEQHQLTCQQFNSTIRKQHQQVREAPTKSVDLKINRQLQQACQSPTQSVNSMINEQHPIKPVDSPIGKHHQQTGQPPTTPVNSTIPKQHQPPKKQVNSTIHKQHEQAPQPLTKPVDSTVHQQAPQMPTKSFNSTTHNQHLQTPQLPAKPVDSTMHKQHQQISQSPAKPIDSTIHKQLQQTFQPPVKPINSLIRKQRQKARQPLLKSVNSATHKQHKQTRQPPTKSVNSTIHKQHQQTCQPINLTAFSCQLCQNSFQNQLSFFEHLKIHYEPTIEVKKIAKKDTKELNIKVDIPNEFSLSSNDDLFCAHCNLNFSQIIDFKNHIQDVHIKIELEEFNDENSVNDTRSWDACGIEEIRIKEEYCSEPEEKDSCLQ